MDSEKSSGSGANKNESQSLLSTHKDITSASTFARNRVIQMEELEKEFDEMGQLGLFWDSKIPEDSKSFFKWFSFKCSDKEKVKEEIRKYLKFYKEMHTAMEKIRGNKKKSKQESEDPLSIISDLEELLTGMDKVAQSDVTATDSTALYKLHKEFIAKHTQIENMVKRVECVVSRDRIKTLTSLLDNCQNTLTEFQNEMQEFRALKNGMEMQIALLVEENEKQRQHQKSLMAVNSELREGQLQLLNKYNNTCDLLESSEKKH